MISIVISQSACDNKFSEVKGRSYLNDLNITNTQALGYGGKEEMPNITLWSYLWRDQVHQHIIITLKT